MIGLLSRAGLRFLYRSDEGTVDRKTWWLGVIALAAILLVLVVIWMVFRPRAGRGLNERAMLDPMTIAAYIYAIIFAFAAIVIAVSYVNLCAKRFRARGYGASWPLGLSGLPLIVLLVAGAAQWLNWRVPQSVPDWSVLVLMAACSALFLWHLIELGVRPDHSP